MGQRDLANTTTRQQDEEFAAWNQGKASETALASSRIQNRGPETESSQE